MWAGYEALVPGPSQRLWYWNIIFTRRLRWDYKEEAVIKFWWWSCIQGKQRRDIIYRQNVRNNLVSTLLRDNLTPQPNLRPSYSVSVRLIPRHEYKDIPRNSSYCFCCCLKRGKTAEIVQQTLPTPKPPCHILVTNLGSNIIILTARSGQCDGNEGLILVA